MDIKGRLWGFCFVCFFIVYRKGEIRVCFVVYGKDPVMVENLKTQEKG